jgi:hypothetical protein
MEINNYIVVFWFITLQSFIGSYQYLESACRLQILDTSFKNFQYPHETKEWHKPEGLAPCTVLVVSHLQLLKSRIKMSFMQDILM